ncbi:hypothetical protein SFV1gp17 [Sulfolobus filamentous virus 1]|uniref:Uncharacterized protein n=1 Tax=Sulfolobus filamentous virus 1 TaxID=2304198 RepID=A0A346LU56_SUFV1|nr:hypothetical protein HOT91_gp17 [Sulfolobus filamentous virus 1]AXQ00099.1 hypothetical protein SFV1gp17 [Sulfolobus filamentous virus 1]
MILCKKVNVVLVKSQNASDDIITWDELQTRKDIVSYEILERDNFFTWRAKAKVCFKRTKNVNMNMSKEERFLYIYMNYRGLTLLEKNEYTFYLSFLCKRLNRCTLYNMLIQNENSDRI